MGLVFCGVHFALFRGRVGCGWDGGRMIILGTFGASLAGGIGGGVVVPTVGAVGRGGGATIGNGTEVAFLGTCGVGAAMLGFSVVQGADRADGVVIFADWGGVAVSLTIAAAGGFIGRVGDLDFPLAREEENMGAHLLSFLRGGGYHHRGGVLEGAGVGVWIEEASGGDCEAFGIKDGGFKVDK